MRFSLLHIAIACVLVGLGLTAAIATMRSFAHIKETPDAQHCLQKLYSPDRRACFELNVRFHLTSESGSVDVHERHTISNVVLYGIRQLVDDPMSPPLLFEKPFQIDFVTKRTTGPAPLWSSRFVSDVVLPSGRLLWAKDGQLLFVLFDGKQCELYKCDSEQQRLRAVDSHLDYNDELRDLFRTSFAPDDVFWSYALVNCAEFFGAKAPKSEHKSGRIDISDLYAIWQQACRVDTSPSTKVEDEPNDPKH